jgi:hypothetical protein
LEFAPSTSDLRLRRPEECAFALTADQEFALKKAHDLLSFHALKEGLEGVLNREDICNAVKAITDMKEPPDALINDVIDRFCTSHDKNPNRPTMNLDEFRKLMLSGVLHPMHMVAQRLFLYSGPLR